MPFRIEVDGHFVFTDDAIVLTIGGTRLDLSKIENLEEWRTTMYLIATQSLARIAKPSIQKLEGHPAPRPAVSSTEEAMKQMGDQFRQQQDEISKRTQELQANLVRQYNELASVHASALSGNGPSRPDDKA